MRDVARIERVLDLIETIWRRYPDMRLTQIIGNVAPGDNYELEDEVLEMELRRTYDRLAANDKAPAAQ